jgi:hypothetical protein
MDHPCHKCNQPVEEGLPFCAHCGAPQIRVAMADPAPQPVTAAGGVLEPEPLPGATVIAAIPVPSRLSHAVAPCALAAAVAIVLTLLGLHPLVTTVGAGGLAVVFYRQRNPLAPIRPGIGAQLGALAGVLGFGMAMVLSAFVVAALHKAPDIRKVLLESVQQSAARYSDPQYQAALDLMRSPAGLVAMMVFALILGFFLCVVFSSLGGALTAALLARRDPR